MTKDVNEQVEAEEIGEGIDLEAQGAAPRRKRGGFWAVMTLIFVLATAVLAWLYTVQLDELQALRAEADQASGQVVRLQQANRRISGELAGLVEKLQEVVKVVNELQEVEGVQPADVATKALKSQPAEEAKPAEQQRPRASQPRVPAVPPKP